ncbi:MAG: hemerythrin family protein [Acidobacteriota bacterium]|jgi:hemerythrin-like metal-binding protein|nr:hemerythrin family protein [Acidobacteriota bacterium]
MDYSLLIQWKDVNNLGIPIIDDQHRGIVSVINSLAFFVQRNKGEFYLNTTFAMMDSYTKLHFSTEEELLRAAGYPEFDGHRRLHTDLIRESFFTANESIRLCDPDIYLRFLKNWWMEHINRCDRMYAQTVADYISATPDGKTAEKTGAANR